MKENWTCENNIEKGDLFIIVANYESSNEVYNWGCKKLLNI